MIIFGLTILGFWFEIGYDHAFGKLEDYPTFWKEDSNYCYGTELGIKGFSLVLYTPIKRKKNARP